MYIYILYHSFWGSGGSLSKKRWGMGEAASWTIDFTKTQIFNNLVWLVYWDIDNQIFNNWTQSNSDIRTKILLYQLWLDTRFPLSLLVNCIPVAKATIAGDRDIYLLSKLDFRLQKLAKMVSKIWIVITWANSWYLFMLDCNFWGIAMDSSCQHHLWLVMVSNGLVHHLSIKNIKIFVHQNTMVTVSTPWVPLAHRQPADSARRLLVLRDLVAWQHPLGGSDMVASVLSLEWLKMDDIIKCLYDIIWYYIIIWWKSWT